MRREGEPVGAAPGWEGGPPAATPAPPVTVPATVPVNVSGAGVEGARVSRGPNEPRISGHGPVATPKEGIGWLVAYPTAFPGRRSVRPELVLLVGVALLATSSALIKWLIAHGGALAGSGAISFCNVLFVGNLCGGLLAAAFFGPRRLRADARRLDLRGGLDLAIGAGFAVAIPWLLFTALRETTVTNLVLLGRFESVAIAVLAAALGSVRLTGRQWAGNAIIVAGVTTVVLIEGRFGVMHGDWLVVGAAVLQAVAGRFARRAIERSGLALFVVTRNAVSAVVFFAIAWSLYGPDHFMDAFGPGLWLVMSGYALVVVVGGQLAWYRGLEALPAPRVANLSLTSPLFGLLAAFVLVGERPGAAQLAGGAVIALGMLLAARGGRRDLPTTPQGLDRALAGS